MEVGTPSDRRRKRRRQTRVKRNRLVGCKAATGGFNDGGPSGGRYNQTQEDWEVKQAKPTNGVRSKRGTANVGPTAALNEATVDNARHHYGNSNSWNASLAGGLMSNEDLRGKNKYAKEQGKGQPK